MKGKLSDQQLDALEGILFGIFESEFGLCRQLGRMQARLDVLQGSKKNQKPNKELKLHEYSVELYEEGYEDEWAFVKELSDKFKKDLGEV